MRGVVGVGKRADDGGALACTLASVRGGDSAGAALGGGGGAGLLASSLALASGGVGVCSCVGVCVCGAGASFFRAPSPFSGAGAEARAAPALSPSRLGLGPPVAAMAASAAVGEAALVWQAVGDHTARVGPGHGPVERAVAEIASLVPESPVLGSPEAS